MTEGQNETEAKIRAELSSKISQGYAEQDDLYIDVFLDKLAKQYVVAVSSSVVVQGLSAELINKLRGENEKLKGALELVADYLVDQGPCEHVDVYGEEAYCSDASCAYCKMARAVSLALKG